MQAATVYLITNTVNGKRYVGVTRYTLMRIAAKKNKPVECTTLAVAFDSASDAAEATGIHVSTISKVCLGKLRTAHGLRFQYV